VFVCQPGRSGPPACLWSPATGEELGDLESLSFLTETGGTASTSGISGTDDWRSRRVVVPASFSLDWDGTPAYSGEG